MNYSTENIEDLREFLDLDYFFAHLGLRPIKSLFEHRIVNDVTREEALAYVLWRSFFNPHHSTCVMEARHVQAKNDILLLMKMYSRRLIDLGVGVIHRNSTEIRFENKNRISALCNPSSLRGRSINHGLVSTEISGETLKDIHNCLIPSISSYQSSAGLIYFS